MWMLVSSYRISCCNVIKAYCLFSQWQSKFEFQLRLQEFIELVRSENNVRAIAYARKYLAPWGATHMKELQRVMATLAFKSNTECPTYKVNFVPCLSFFLSYGVGGIAIYVVSIDCNSGINS